VRGETPEKKKNGHSVCALRRKERGEKAIMTVIILTTVFRGRKEPFMEKGQSKNYGNGDDY